MNNYKNDYIIKQREERKKVNKKKDRLIKDVRISYSFPGYQDETFQLFSWYRQVYENLFRNLFQEKGLKCPKYNHIYIHLSSTLEDALNSTINNYQIPWFEIGISSLDIDKYLKANEEEKMSMLFESICDGMRDIFTIDKLDMTILEDTIHQIKENGVFQELVHKEIKDTKRKFNVSYNMTVEQDKVYYDVYFNLQVLDESHRIYFGRLDSIDKIYYWFKHIRFSYDNVLIQPSDNTSSVLTLKENYCALKIPFELFNKLEPTSPFIKSKYFKKLKYAVYEEIDTKKHGIVKRAWKKYIEFLSQDWG